MFYPYIMISAVQAPRKLRSTPRDGAIFLLSFLFFRRGMNLGIREATKYSSGASSKKREKKAAFMGCLWRSLRIRTAFARHCDIIGPRMRPSKDAAPELGHNLCGQISSGS